VVGGGNSAGQAALFLSEIASFVHLVVRSADLTHSMSRYLIRRIEANPKIKLLTNTVIARLDGSNHLESVECKNNLSGKVDARRATGLFSMIGAVPNSSWLKGCLALDERSFIKTGPEITNEDLRTWNWPLARSPLLYETTLPGVFAVGDIRSGSVKRVASAVGEGSVAISLVHRVLAEAT